MASPTLKFKRGLYSQLPTLAVGEPGFTTDRNQLYVGSPDGNQLIGGGNFWNLESTTAGGGIKLYEGTNNGTNYVELQSPDALTSNLEFTLPSADASASGQLLQSNASGVLSFGEVALTHIDIDGGTDIGAAITDSDLFIVDDGAGGTNRKTEASRIKSYILGGGTPTFTSATIGGQTINATGINVSGVTTSSGGFVGGLTGDVTGTADKADTVGFTPELSSSSSHFIAFAESGSYVSLKRDSGLTYVPNTNTLTASAFVGDITGDVTGNLTGTVQTASQTNITSVGTLGSLAVTNNITVGGTVDGRDVLDDGQAGDNLVTLSGVARDATDLGTFTGAIISDNETIKVALQDLETELENVAGGGAQATSVATQSDSTDASFFPTFVADNNGSATQENVKTDAGISYNPSSNILTVSGSVAANVTGDLTGTIQTAAQTNITSVGTLGSLDVTNNITVGGSVDGRDVLDDGQAGDNLVTLSGVARDATNLGTFTGSIISDNDTVKGALQDLETSLAGVAVTFALAADSGTADVFQTAQTLTFSGTSGEVETVVSNNEITIGLPATVNITTELDVPTIETGAIQAKDGTAAVTITDSTGKVTVSTDLEAQGTLTATSGASFQGDTDIGNQTSDTLTVTARVDSDFVPSTDSARSLGTNALRFLRANVDEVVGTAVAISGIATASQFKGSSLTMSGGGIFGGNVNITGNLSVGGSITNVDVQDLRIISPVIELGLEDDGDGKYHPPAQQTQYNSGVVMYYNHVGVSSANAKAAAMFAGVRLGGNMRIGFATDVSIINTAIGDSVSTVNHWAEIEARGLWMNDCAGQSVVINCTGTERHLNNIIVDGGTFA